MERYAREQRTRIISWYYENRKCIIKTQRAYKINYGSKSTPATRTIKKMVQNFEEYGTVADKPRIGATKTVRTLENIKKIPKKLDDSPRRSQRRLSKETKISRSSVQDLA